MAKSALHSLDTISKLLDLTPRRVQQLSKSGVIPKSARGRYELVSAVQGYIRYLRDRSIEAGIISIDVARQRKTAAEAELAEIELAKARAAVVLIDDVARQWESILGGVRTRFLALPTKLAPLVAVENKQKIVEEIISDGVYTALGQLVTGISDDAGSYGEPEPSAPIELGKVETATEDNDKPVGRQRKKTIAGS